MLITIRLISLVYSFNFKFFIAPIVLSIGLRYMTRALARLNDNRNGHPPYTHKLFHSYVKIDFDAALERRVFEVQPARRVARRHSVARQPHSQPQQQQQQTTPTTRRKRSASVDTRSYIAPVELRPVIDSYRRSIGKVLLNSQLYIYSFFFKFP